MWSVDKWNSRIILELEFGHSHKMLSNFLIFAQIEQEFVADFPDVWKINMDKK